MLMMPSALPESSLLTNSSIYPKDDKFLEIALNGKAHLILTGDTDLLALHPWQGVAILSPARYLKR
jgi:predicted nucleic acid-binding protein